MKDVDLAGGRLIVRAAKGNRDRVVMLPMCLRDEMEWQLKTARAVWRADARGECAASGAGGGGKGGADGAGDAALSTA